MGDRRAAWSWSTGINRPGGDGAAAEDGQRLVAVSNRAMQRDREGGEATVIWREMERDARGRVAGLRPCGGFGGDRVIGGDGEEIAAILAARMRSGREEGELGESVGARVGFKVDFGRGARELGLWPCLWLSVLEQRGDGTGQLGVSGALLPIQKE
ncbi:hypothetical protein OsI_22938 [Oryza sativa Indica Group]|uniref:Uncharacterized protein n=1 Tax=Oryza sativa subsp. indica TaxID=39946 RepID=A2YCU7_ORYSI|nr:hypothetical protein OsI_22938 [Oryza sativa Indica Group]